MNILIVNAVILIEHQHHRLGQCGQVVNEQGSDMMGWREVGSSEHTGSGSECIRKDGVQGGHKGADKDCWLVIVCIEGEPGSGAL